MEQLTDRELVRAWTHTTRAVDATSDPGRRLALAVTRQYLLDEMWARDRYTFERWIADGAPHRDAPVRGVDPD